MISELGFNTRWKESLLMKDIGPAKQILGMKVIIYHSKKLIWLSQEKYTEKALKRFNMDKAKPVSVPLAEHFKLSTMQCPTSEEEKERDEQSALFFYGRKPNVCHNLHRTRYCPCSWCCESILVQSWRRTLECSEVDIEIF